MEKHLYVWVDKTGKYKHSIYCWCEQKKIFGEPGQELKKALDDIGLKYAYPNEVNDPYCRCVQPTVLPPVENAIHGMQHERCVLCGRILKRSKKR